jgi:hypothetical protein
VSLNDERFDNYNDRNSTALQFCNNQLDPHVSVSPSRAGCAPPMRNEGHVRCKPVFDVAGVRASKQSTSTVQRRECHLADEAEMRTRAQEDLEGLRRVERQRP